MRLTAPVPRGHVAAPEDAGGSSFRVAQGQRWNKFGGKKGKGRRGGKKRSGAKGKRPQSATSGGGNPGGAIRRYDKNGDRRLSRSEWPKGNKKFNFIDANKDGYLSRGELQSARARRAARRAPAAPVSVWAEDDAKSLTLAEAKELTAEAGDQPIAAVPPSIADITAILDEQKLADPKLAEKSRIAAGVKPPTRASKSKLMDFYRARGLAAEKIGDSAQQLSDLATAAELARKIRSPKRHIIVNDLAVAAGQRGRQEESIGLREQAVAIVSKYKGKNGFKIKVLSVLVARYAALGKLHLATRKMAAVEQLLGNTKRNRRMRGRWRYEWFPRAMFAKASLLEAQGRIEKAEPLFRGGIKLISEGIRRGYDKHGNRAAGRDLTHKFFLRQALTRNLLKQGRVVEAEIEARGTLLEGLSEVGKYSTATPSNLLQLVGVLREQGRYNEATELAAAAIDIMKTIGFKANSGVMVKARRVQAQATFQAGRVDEALALYDQIRETVANERDLYERFLLTDNEWMLALVLAGRHSEAIAVIRESFETKKARRRGQGRMRKGILAIALARNGDRGEAETLFRGVVPRLIASVEEQGDEEYTLKTSREFRVTAILEGYLDLLADLTADAASDMDRQRFLAESFRIADVARGRSVQRAVSAASARATVRDPELAGLARAEQDTRKRITAQSGTLAGILSSPLDEQDSEAVAEITESIQTLRAAADSLNQEIRRKFPAYAKLLNPSSPDPKTVREALRDGEAFISIYGGRDRTFVWAVPKEGEPQFAATALSRERTEKIVTALRGALNPRVSRLGDVPDFDLRLAYRLFRQTLKPVRPAWSKAKSLLLVVNGALGQLPLSVLPVERFRLDDKADGALFAAYRDVPWLARTHAVTFVPSAAAFVTLRSTPDGRPGRQPFIGFGDPFFSRAQAAKAEAKERRTGLAAATGDQSFRSRALPIFLRAVPNAEAVGNSALAVLPRLPDTAEEVRSIAVTLATDPSTSVKLGPQANEAAVKVLRLADYRVVAFATHGLTPGDLPGLREPALALSAPDVSDSDGDGLLTMTEIMGLRLDADWVILSACNTGTGRGAGAEAVSGLGRAFFYAGTRSLLVSSWPVETVSARLLTTDIFRRQQVQPAMDRAEALRQAMSALIDRPGLEDKATNRPIFYYAHPIFWAPFILVGDGGGANQNP